MHYDNLNAFVLQTVQRELRGAFMVMYSFLLLRFFTTLNII